MPRMTVCTEDSCTELVPAGRSYTKCAEHAPAAWAVASARNREKPRNWNALRLVVRRRDRNRCAVCGGYGREVDHIVPVAQGGKSVLSNLQVMCTKHHTEKTRRERQR